MNSNESADESYGNSLAVWAPLTSHQANLAREMSDVLEALAQKRVTLEEKLIRRYLHELVAECGSVIAWINRLLQNQPQMLDPQLAAKLHEIDDEIFLDIRQLKKMIEYNPNFLEQYFEHGFYARLENDRRYLQRLASVSAELESLGAG
ncbi:MAG TPA: hypothetical protein V6C72_10410 [Chroococcales cyanobacterium]